MIRTSGLGVLFCLVGCQVDLDSATSAVDDPIAQVGTVVLFGEFSGTLVRGDGEQSGSLLFYAGDCGESIEGTLQLGTETFALEGSLLGSTLKLSTDEGAKSFVFIGEVNTPESIEGLWISGEGEGGTWIAAYSPGSLSDFPCPYADNLDVD